MSPIVKIKITYDNEQAVFFSGAKVTGHIHVIVEEKGGAKIRGVKIEWKGQSSTHFRFQSNKYSKSETHLENEMYIMGSGDRSKPTILLQEGTHAIPFSVLLPPNIPGSFELKRGKISYQIYAKVNIPYDIFDPNTTRPFVVIKQNLILPAACNPLQGSIQEQVGMCCFSRGDVSANVGLQRSGFVPGEDLHFSLNIENESTKEIARSLVEVCQYTYYFGIKRTKNKTYKRDQFNKRKQMVNAPHQKDLEIRKVWTEVEFPPIKPGDTFTSADNVLNLNPKLLLSNLFEGCTIMKTHYTLEVTLFLGRLYSCKTTKIPIEIGSSYTSGAPMYNEPNIFIPAQTVPAVPLIQAPYPSQPPTYPSGGPFPNYPSQFGSQGPIMEAPQIHQPPSAPFFAPNIPTAPNLGFSLPPPYNPLPEEQKLP